MLKLSIFDKNLPIFDAFNYQSTTLPHIHNQPMGVKGGKRNVPPTLKLFLSLQYIPYMDTKKNLSNVQKIKNQENRDKQQQHQRCSMFRQKTNAFDDCCSVNIRERQSFDTGVYQTNNFFRKCDEPVMTNCTIDQPMTFPQVWGNVYQCKVDDDSVLRYAPLTNLRDIQQLFARPYVDAGYKGAGANSGHLKDLESSLMQGQFGPHYGKELDNTHEINVDRFEFLPECNNPQRIQHVIMPITRGGVLTRELVRRLNYVDYNTSLNNARGSIGLELQGAPERYSKNMTSKKA